MQESRVHLIGSMGGGGSQPSASSTGVGSPPASTSTTAPTWQGHFYPVPHTLIRALVDVRLAATTVEIFHRGTRLVVHTRSHVPGWHTTVAANLSHAHRAHQEWSPSRLRRRGATLGPETAAVVRRHPRRAAASGARLCRRRG